MKRLVGLSNKVWGVGVGNIFTDYFDNKDRYLYEMTQRHKCIGSLCVHIPEEIIYAAGFQPVRLTSSIGPIVEAEGYLPSYICGFARGCLENALKKNYEHLEGVVFPHTCDTIRQLFPIWKMHTDHPYNWFLSYPMVLDSGEALELAYQEMLQFKSSLESFSGQAISDTTMWNAIRLFNEIRTALEEIAEKVTYRELWYITNAGFVMQKEDYLRLLKREIDRGKREGHNRVKRNGKRTLHLTGSVIETPSILELIEEEGGEVVSDDLCTGSRYYFHEVEEKGDDPIMALAKSYVGRAICPCKNSVEKRIEYMEKLIKKSDPECILFVIQKFCDPHLFDFPTIKNHFEKQGVMVQKIEIEHDSDANEGVRTRVKALFEVLGGR